MCIRAPPCTSAHKSVHNPASMDGDQVRGGGCSSKVGITWTEVAWDWGCREPGTHQTLRMAELLGTEE